MSYVLKVRRVSLPSPPNTLEILENYYFSPRRHPENVENVEQKKKKTLLQWIELEERSPKMCFSIHDCITQREPRFRCVRRCAREKFAYDA